MKIVFFGDSITDSSRERGTNDAGRVSEPYINKPTSYGAGYVFLIASQLLYDKPNYYQILNRGIGGDRLPQLYARIQLDVWNESPDVLSILIGYNDVNTGSNLNYTDIERWDKIYRLLISDTLEKCPNTKIIICEPFSAKISELESDNKQFPTIKDYAKKAKQIANDFNLPFVSLQESISELLKTYNLEDCFYDGVHPNLVGSKIIADKWLQVFKTQVLKTL